MKSVREMIREAARNSALAPGGLGSGGAEPGASTATPDRACRPVDTGSAPACRPAGMGCSLCRVIGFIPFSKAQ